MSMIPLLDAADVLRRHGLRPNARLGQNFLQDPAALENIAAAAGIHPTDTVLEIGCGLGQLTRYLAASAQRVIAVEFDPRLASIAESVLKQHRNVRVICADILKLALGDLGIPSGYVVAANIPYNITSPIIRRLLEAQVKPRRIVLTVQAEVAERICSGPPRMSILTLSVQVYGSPVIVERIPSTAFFPVPKVDSAIVRIDVLPQPRIPQALLPVFFGLIKASFGQKRKKLRNSLAAALRMSAAQVDELLHSAGIDPGLRAEALGFDEWQRLAGIPGLVRALQPDRAA